MDAQLAFCFVSEAVSTQSERPSSQMQPCTSAQEDGECSVHVSAVDTTVSKVTVSNILIAEVEFLEVVKCGVRLPREV